MFSQLFLCLTCWAFMVASCNILMGSQGDHPSKDPSACIEILSDFVFVGSGTYDSLSVPEHGLEKKPLPSQFKAGHQYIFHHPNSGNGQDLYKTLLSRLQARGVKIISSSNDMDRYIGGPGFRIAFQEKGCKGFIYNNLDKQIVNNESLIKQWSLDDYILVLEEVGSSN